MRILKGETSVAEVEGWEDPFLRATENELRWRPKDEQIKKLKQKIGDLVVENDVLRQVLKPYPLVREVSDARKRTILTFGRYQSIGLYVHF